MSVHIEEKMEYWKHQLLDLGKRNRMINYRKTRRSTLQLVAPSPEELFRRIAIDEESLTFQRPVDRETDLRVFSILSLLENLSAPLPVTIGDIQAEGSILERQKTLKHMRAKARLSLEEQGTNILYLSFGFIEWRDGKGASAQWIRSPLILVPAVLSLEALNAPYTLSKHEDDIVVNPTLQHYLKTEWGIELPGFDPDKDTLSGYLEQLEPIADQRGWRIVNEVSLGLLSFLKISMYNDLVRNQERIQQNPVIRAMSGDAAAMEEIPPQLQGFDLDSIPTRDCYQVMSADSSQQDAILYSRHGISFVMQGPPGTGKSQTITNIIAEALAQGKKVLFVSEKMAALQVVYRRLQDAHLGDFCLPLHSYKANKKQILEQIGANLELKQTRVRDEAIQDLEQLLVIRQELNRYAQQLHQLNPRLGLSCYEVYSKLEALCHVPGLAFSLDEILEVDQAQLQVYRSKLGEYALSRQRIGQQIHNNPWQGLTARTTGYLYSQTMEKHLTDLRQHLAALQDCLDSIPECPRLQDHADYAALPVLAQTIEELCQLPPIPENWLDPDTMPALLKLVREAGGRMQQLQDLEQEVSQVFLDGIDSLAYEGWLQQVQQAAGQLVGAPLLPEAEATYYVENISNLYSNVSFLASSLPSYQKLAAAISDDLGIRLEAKPRCFAVLQKLPEYIRSMEVAEAGWFTADLPSLRSLVQEAKAHTQQLQGLKARLLQDWEESIFDLDYAPILLRFKTEYTHFFRVFHHRYHADKRQLLAHSRRVLKHFSDDDATGLLFALQAYHTHAAWLENNRSRLDDALGSCHQGSQTRWDAVLHALEQVEAIRAIPQLGNCGKLPQRVTEDREQLAESLDTTLDCAATMTQTLQLCLDLLGIDLQLLDEGCDLEELLNKVNSCYLPLEQIHQLLQQLTPYLRNENTEPGTILRTLSKLGQRKALQEAVSADEADCRKTFDFLYTGRSTNWQHLSGLLRRLHALQQLPLYHQLRTLPAATAAHKQQLLQLADRLPQLHAACQESLAWLSQQFADGELTVAALADLTGRRLEAMDSLGGWIDYQEAREDCCQSGLESFIGQLEAEQPEGDVLQIFEKGFYRMWLEAVCQQAEGVRRFRSNTQEARIQKFIQLDDLQLLIAQMRIRERLIENLPSDHQLLRATDEVAILKKELNKRRNIMPLRKLFKLIPNLLMKLKPCLMMSPLSVSYFLETEAYHFDLVIFDEASQIFPEDAIGAIFRGAQVIIAGDSKQLPPTNFFAATTGSNDFDQPEDDLYDDVVSDSILEETAAVLPNRTLLWHYRSKQESLIAFSNAQIYNNSLITFPSSVSGIADTGVEYVYVPNGVYDRGGKKDNVREAWECVQLVFAHIEKYPDRSLGIIAFSESQQAAIENAIIDHRERHPQYEWFFDESRDEPFFVKNLENVQGDERDTILFSICYGKDKHGQMHMNFGPLGKVGGERRLNVAITRAKCNIKLVGSILPADIDLNRVSTEGPRLLRKYMEYAISGTGTLSTARDDTPVQDDFCRIVADFLTQKGYHVHTRVGCSDFKLDIAIAHPEHPEEYIAGIICDGYSYVQARTARDRDHLRYTVLRNMGWNLYRVWSTAWVQDPAAEQAALLHFLSGVVDPYGYGIHVLPGSREEWKCDQLANIATETEKDAPATPADNPYGFAYYREARWWEAPAEGQNDELSRIARWIRHVVAVEQPIHLELLYRRLGPAFTAGKATESVKHAIDQVIAQLLADQVQIDEAQFVRLLPLTDIVPRIPAPHTTPRPMELIHTQEVAAAMYRIATHAFGLPVDDLATECARVFGFERRGPKIKRKTDAAVEFLVREGMLRIIDGKVQPVSQ